MPIPAGKFEEIEKARQTDCPKEITATERLASTVEKMAEHLRTIEILLRDLRVFRDSFQKGR